MTTADEVLDFWFGDALDSPEAALARCLVWFQGGDEFDQEIRRRFGSLPGRAQRDEFVAWARAPRSALALVIVLDQFPRNLFRGTARAFECDARARSVAREALEAGHDLELDPLEATFLYLPFEHSEDLRDQHHCVALYEQLVKRVPSGQTALYEQSVDYARRHRDTIERFGRFPHRNQALGRQPTPEEVAYLDQGGDTF
jgi:uncharacterized protein (DUF924 family)